MKSTVEYSVSDCSLGSVLVASSTKGVCAVLLGASPAVLQQDLQERFPDAGLTETAVTAVHKKVIAFVDAPRASLDVPLDARGTDFQRRVWRALREIPRVQRQVISTSPTGSGQRSRCALSPLLVLPTRSRLRSLVIG